MVSGNLLEQLDRSPNIMQDHERFRRAANNTYTLNEHDQLVSNESTPSTGSFLMEKQSHLTSRQVEQAFSALSMQEPNTMRHKTNFGNLENSFQQHDFVQTEDTCLGATRDFLMPAPDSFNMSPEACATDISTPSEGYSSEHTNRYVDNNPFSGPRRNKVAYGNPFVCTPPKFSRFSTNESYGSTTSSVTSSHQKNSISPCQPMLYSAIGSFENLNNSSSYLRDITAKMISMKQTNQHTRLLIPPVRPQENLNSGNNILAKNNCEENNSFRQRQEQTFPSSNEELTIREEPLIDSDTEPKASKNKHVSTLTQQLSNNSLNEIGLNETACDDHPIMHKSTSLVANLTNLEDSPELIQSKYRREKIVKIEERDTGGKKQKRMKRSRKSKNKKPEVIFCPSSDAYTPRISSSSKPLSYVSAAERDSSAIPTTMGTISRPNFRDALRRVAMILHQHIVKIERRFESNMDPSGLFSPKMRKEFKEDNFAKPRYKCTMVRVPMARGGAIYSLKKLKADYETPDSSSPASVRIPTELEIYEFAHKLFKKVQLSSECSIVCLIYIERLMEVARVPLLACTWRPIFMAGLLLASKVWQDLSSWNIEFAIVYPQFSLESINRLELQFLRMVKWDLYISSSLYAKYYFALRSLLEKKSFRQRYNRMVGGVGNVYASDALKIQQRTEKVKEQALLQLSRSM